ncbi:hypothetical protein USDA257_c00960 [Sinorhizobium fredii USDA 257]|uniref:Uncharacterized protein n=1 Tax=Sinorhizobium fredii (strain USDA 257) TaxID=1185652 RepID=I3WYJ2_SINF2|nr:hypothetical protein USDA257_c00960 [Sinorhizobium fredii USDA 257]
MMLLRPEPTGDLLRLEHERAMGQLTALIYQFALLTRYPEIR